MESLKDFILSVPGLGILPLMLEALYMPAMKRCFPCPKELTCAKPFLEGKSAIFYRFHISKVEGLEGVKDGGAAGWAMAVCQSWGSCGQVMVHTGGLFCVYITSLMIRGSTNDPTQHKYTQSSKY
ncbi:unnamed protein product [Eretmochelys imbricata]